MEKDTLKSGESMPLHISLTYKGKRKFCLRDDMTVVSFQDINGWKKKHEDHRGRMYNGPKTISIRSGGSVGYNLDLEDYFDKIPSGKFFLKYQIMLYNCRRSQPVTLNDSVPVFIVAE